MADNKTYSKAELEKLIVETTRHGAIYCNLYFDAHAKTEEHVKHSLIDFIARLSKEDGVLYCVGEILPAIGKGEEEKEDGSKGFRLYSTSAHVKLLADSFNTLLVVCLKYGPVGLEIIEPSKITLSLDDATHALLDASIQSQTLAELFIKRALPHDEISKLDRRLAERAEAGRRIAEASAGSTQADAESKPAGGSAAEKGKATQDG